MITSYKTKNGVTLILGQVDRQDVLRLLSENKPPKPPTRKAIIFGGGTEDVEILDDPDYLKAKARYDAEIYQKQFDIIYKGIEYDYSMHNDDIEALYHVGVPRGVRESDILHYVVLTNTKDANYVCNAVIYNSVVTQQAINEAYNELSVKWLNSYVQSMNMQMSPASTSMEFECMRAARYCYVPWDRFCKMTGPEQSKIVAYYRLDNKLEWLRSKK